MASRREAHSQPSEARPIDGRDHLNLAEHRISVLPRRQPVDEQGRKQDEVTYRSTRYDPLAKRRVPRSVTLTTNSRLGLPTPADENVLLALLYMARRENGFNDSKVHFTPHELFVLMHWSPNSRSYERFRSVLERLSALRLIYRNAWWDTGKRAFETEFSTGLIASYKLTRQTAGRRKAGTLPPSWIEWNPNFFESLQAGAVKRLNLKQVFGLKTPASQQAYRYLDKHFYYSPHVELDLREFACGHVGLSEAYDNGKLKSRLRPTIHELESIEFIEPAEDAQRFRKVRPGVWRVRFEKRRQPSADTAHAAAGKEGDLSVVRHLAARGVTTAVARQLAADHPAELIHHKLSVLNWLLSQKHPSVSTNPAGFLVQSIRQQYSDPPGYRSAIPPKSAPVRRRVTTSVSAAGSAPLDRAQRDAAQRIEQYLAKLSAADRTALEQEALSIADAPLARLYRRAESDQTRSSLLKAIVRRHVSQRLSRREQPPPEGGELSANSPQREPPQKRL